MISQHLASLSLYDDTDLLIGTFAIKSGSLSLDDNRAPFVTASVVLTLPKTSAERFAIDPRARLIRAVLELQKVYSGSLPIAALTNRYRERGLAGATEDMTRPVGSNPSTIADLAASFENHWNGYPSPPRERLLVEMYLVESVADYAADELSMTLAGAEFLMQQDVSSGQAPYAPGAVALLDVVRYVIESLGIGYVLESDAASHALIEADASEWKTGVSGWDYLRPLVEAAGLRLWADVAGFWHLLKRIPSDSISAWSTANTKALTDKVSRSGSWGDAVVVIYEWEDADGNQRQQVDYAKLLANPNKPRVFRRSSPYPGPGAAAYLLRFVQTRGRDVDLTAVSDYTIAPGGRAYVQLPTGTRLTKTIAAVQYALGNDDMTVTLRDQLAEGEED
ncbi:hypothetical protein [Rathayibacter sp. AY1A7]|uniref:hypothetical protein n=1 Tax=Rathayibacter sp. AY1A7 TaxID=2080524 RepID=UPI000CE7EF31|nr:hypothetical protein [Rathayibacter sp. AY1A7]PPF21034.1 hypothetical protein C5B95_06385 [Rathayibacter sp. AY1A7]